jgi:hypothetical protein
VADYEYEFSLVVDWIERVRRTQAHVEIALERHDAEPPGRGTTRRWHERLELTVGTALPLENWTFTKTPVDPVRDDVREGVGGSSHWLSV